MFIYTGCTTVSVAPPERGTFIQRFTIATTCQSSIKHSTKVAKSYVAKLMSFQSKKKKKLPLK